MLLNHIYLIRNWEGKDYSYRNSSTWNVGFVQLVYNRLRHHITNHCFLQWSWRCLQPYKTSCCVKQRWWKNYYSMYKQKRAVTPISSTPKERRWHWGLTKPRPLGADVPTGTSRGNGVWIYRTSLSSCLHAGFKDHVLSRTGERNKGPCSE